MFLNHLLPIIFLLMTYIDNTSINLFIYLGFYIAFNTVQVISRRVVGRAEETSTYSSSGFCTVNCRPMASNYQLSDLRPCREPNPSLRGGRRECYHSATVVPVLLSTLICQNSLVVLMQSRTGYLLSRLTLTRLCLTLQLTIKLANKLKPSFQ